MPHVIAELLDSQGRQVRQGERRAVAGQAQCRRGVSRAMVELRDLSPGGARVLALAPLRVGHDIWLKLPNMEAIEARVVWTNGCESGCQFARPLHQAVFDSLAGAL